MNQDLDCLINGKAQNMILPCKRYFDKARLVANNVYPHILYGYNRTATIKKSGHSTYIANFNNAFFQTE